MKLHEMLASNHELARRLDQMEKIYDTKFKIVFDAIRELMKPPENPRYPIGFGPAFYALTTACLGINLFWGP